MALSSIIVDDEDACFYRARGILLRSLYLKNVCVSTDTILLRSRYHQEEKSKTTDLSTSKSVEIPTGM